MFHGSELKHKYGSCEVCVCVILLSGGVWRVFPNDFTLHILPACTWADEGKD